MTTEAMVSVDREAVICYICVHMHTVKERHVAAL